MSSRNAYRVLISVYDIAEQFRAAINGYIMLLCIYEFGVRVHYRIGFDNNVGSKLFHVFRFLSHSYLRAELAQMFNRCGFLHIGACNRVAASDKNFRKARHRRASDTHKIYFFNSVQIHIKASPFK